jgi:hypothetical protein
LILIIPRIANILEVRGPCPHHSEISMNKFLALILIGSFAFAAMAEDKKPAETPKKAEACKMECCKKNQASNCKGCPDCKKAAADKAAAEKKVEPKKS